MHTHELLAARLITAVLLQHLAGRLRLDGVILVDTAVQLFCTLCLLIINTRASRPNSRPLLHRHATSHFHTAVRTVIFDI